MSSLHQAWESIPLEGDYFTITATHVKELTGLEPRLMMKWDHSAKLPPVLASSGRFILPLKNGLYAVLRGQGYHRPEPCPEPLEFPRRNTFRLETSESGVSEMQHLDLAFNTGLFAEFTGQPVLYPTLRGRKYSPAFSFQVGEHRLDVESVQIEIDQGYEGPDCILVVEAKIGEPEDFHLRQLYYPFRAWRQRSEKAVRPIFFTFEPSTGLYRFREYAFDPPDIYGPPRLVKAAAYRLVDSRPVPVARLRIKQAAPVPQANTIDVIGRVPVLVALGNDGPKQIAAAFGFDPRQGAYYLNAACSLGLLRRDPYRLSELGEQYVQCSPADREAMLARAILGVPLIQELMISLLLSPTGAMSKAELRSITDKATSSGVTLSESTSKRRAETLWAWLKWVGAYQGSLTLDGETLALRPRPEDGHTAPQLELFALD